MSPPCKKELGLLDTVADELREVFAERGHRVDQAMEVDPAFGSGWSRAAVTRDLVVDGVSGAASRIGLDFRSVNGSGREFRTLDDGVDRRYRLRRATRRTDGSVVIQTNSESALATIDDLTQDSLFVPQQWVFAWTIYQGLIEDTFIAEVLGYTIGNPGYLKLGPAIPLGHSDRPTGGFQPADEGLDEFDEEDGLGEGFGPAAS